MRPFRKIREIWDAASTYEVGEFVFDRGLCYKVLTQNTNDRPPSANWEVVTFPRQAWPGKWDHKDVDFMFYRPYALDSGSGSGALLGYGIFAQVTS